MSHNIIEGVAGRFIEGGFMHSDITDVIPAGEFIKPSGVKKIWSLIDASGAPKVWLNDVETDRNDAVAGGVSAIQGPFTLVTDVFDATQTYTVGAKITVKKVALSTSGTITLADTSNDYINGYVKEAPSALNGQKITVVFNSTNDGQVA